jgi:PAS domain S-box-containing protein
VHSRSVAADLRPRRRSGRKVRKPAGTLNSSVKAPERDDEQFELGEEFAAVLAETTQSLVCVLDEQGRVLLFNDACERATGFARDEVLGRPLVEFAIPPEEREAFGEVLAFIWRSGHASPQVGHWLTKDGRRLLIAWSNKPVLPTDDAPGYLVTTGINLTDRARAREEPVLGDDPEARLAEVGQLAQEQRSLRRVATLVASEASPERVFQAVSEESARVLSVDASFVWRYEGDDTATIVGRYNRDGIDTFPLGTRIHADGERTAIGRVRETGAPARVEDWGVVGGSFAELMLQSGYRSTVAAPIVVAGTLWGAVAIGSAEQHPPGSEVRLGAFCELVSLAVASAQAREDLQASRARIVRAGDEQRRRLERNLHDGAQQRLVAAALLLRVAQNRLDAGGTQPAREMLNDAMRELESGLEELRELARGLHPGTLTEHGLRGALAFLEDRLPLPIEVTVPEARLSQHLEATAYFIVSEALTNVVKHAAASRATVVVAVDDGALRLEIADDGRGGADTTKGTGLLGLRDRAESEGGTLVVVSPPGRGTVVTARLPLEEPPGSA